MRIEYFQLIDRIIALNLADQTIRTEATVPTESTIFEGHFPGYPLMPGVLLIESMAQTAGWLVVAERRFESMPFLASLKAVAPAAPVFLMAETSTNPEWQALVPAPVAKDIPNNHLGYAVTWYGLAAALAGVYAAVLLKRRKG